MLSNKCVKEVSPITPDMKEFINSRSGKLVDWTAPGLKMVRLRLLGSFIPGDGFRSGRSFLEVSYAVGELNGEAVNVRLPFHTLDGRTYKRDLYRLAKESGSFIDGLFSSISILW